MVASTNYTPAPAPRYQAQTDVPTRPGYVFVEEKNGVPGHWERERANATQQRPPVRAQTEIRDQRDPLSVDQRQQAVDNAKFDAIFNNPNLSIEDKVMFLLFAVMDKMDKELTKKSKDVAKAKSDASTADAGGGGDPVKGQNGAPVDSSANGKASLDQQTFELQQLTTRRNNLFSMMNSIVGKFDESAQKVLQKLGQ